MASCDPTYRWWVIEFSDYHYRRTWANEQSITEDMIEITKARNRHQKNYVIPVRWYEDKSMSVCVELD